MPTEGAAARSILLQEVEMGCWLHFDDEAVSPVSSFASVHRVVAKFSRGMPWQLRRRCDTRGVDP